MVPRAVVTSDAAARPPPRCRRAPRCRRGRCLPPRATAEGRRAARRPARHGRGRTAASRRSSGAQAVDRLAGDAEDGREVLGRPRQQVVVADAVGEVIAEPAERQPHQLDIAARTPFSARQRYRLGVQGFRAATSTPERSGTGCHRAPPAPPPPTTPPATCGPRLRRGVRRLRRSSPTGVRGQRAAPRRRASRRLRRRSAASHRAERSIRSIPTCAQHDVGPLGPARRATPDSRRRSRRTPNRPSAAAAPRGRLRSGWAHRDPAPRPRVGAADRRPIVAADPAYTPASIGSTDRATTCSPNRSPTTSATRRVRTGPPVQRP